MAVPATSAWTSGLWDCFSDMGICIIGSCLPCVLYGKNSERHGEGGCFGPCCLYYCCPCFACIFAGGLRTRIRIKYGLPAEPCGDCLVHFVYCSPCGLCQEARELQAREGKAT